MTSIVYYIKRSNRRSISVEITRDLKVLVRSPLKMPDREIREFVEKIYVYKAERIDGRRVQRIKIVYNCIGDFDPPVSTSTTKQEKSA